MATRKTQSANATAKNRVRSLMPPDAQVKQVVVPSGSKLLFTDDDQDAILKFVGMKDITDKYAEKYGKDPKSIDPIQYLTFNDGKKLVSMSMSHTLKDTTFEQGKYYYLRLDSKVQTNVNKEFAPMKDFAVAEYKVPEGSAIDMTWRFSAEDAPTNLDLTKVPLTLDSLAILNYDLLNYPLRKV